MTTQEFIANMAADNQQLVDRMQNCKAPEEAYAVAKGEGVTDSFDEFTAEMTNMYQSARDLSDEDLDNVAGGKMDATQIAAETAIATIVVGLAAASAAS